METRLQLTKACGLAFFIEMQLEYECGPEPHQIVMLVYLEPFHECYQVSVVLHVVFILGQIFFALFAVEPMRQSALDVSVECAEEVSHHAGVGGIRCPPIDDVVLESHQHSLYLVPVVVSQVLEAYKTRIEGFLQGKQVVSQVVAKLEAKRVVKGGTKVQDAGHQRQNTGFVVVREGWLPEPLLTLFALRVQNQSANRFAREHVHLVRDNVAKHLHEHRVKPFRQRIIPQLDLRSFGNIRRNPNRHNHSARFQSLDLSLGQLRPALIQVEEALNEGLGA